MCLGEPPSPAPPGCSGLHYTAQQAWAVPGGLSRTFLMAMVNPRQGGGVGGRGAGC